MSVDMNRDGMRQRLQDVREHIDSFGAYCYEMGYEDGRSDDPTPTPAAPDVAGGKCGHPNHGGHNHDCMPFTRDYIPADHPTPAPQPDEGETVEVPGFILDPLRDDIEAAIYGGAEAVDPDERREVTEAVVAVVKAFLTAGRVPGVRAVGAREDS